MNEIESRCAHIREILPDHVAGRLDDDVVDVEAHLAVCDACRAEQELVALLRSTRVAPPAGLDTRIVAALPGRRPAPHRPWWGLSAAAVAAVALGIGISADPNASDGSRQEDLIATEFEAGDFWVSDDGLVAGAPALDDLSDEALEQLLQELGGELPGGDA